MKISFKQYLDEKRLIVINNGAREGQVVFLAGGAGCFDAQTEIITKNGNKPISEIVAGDIVLSFNETTGEKEWKEVENTHINPLKGRRLVEVYFDDNTSVICTEDHTFYDDETGAWVPASELV